MAKVLISFLGTGQFADKSKRVYSPVNYHLEGKDVGNYSFVGAALKDYYEMNMEKDKIILIGSIHSMWEEIYKTFTPKDKFDEDVHLNIGVFCDDANSKSKLESFCFKETIEKSIGKKSHIVLIKYGADANEIQENLRIILGIQRFLDPSDEIIVDVTHSFRSLPIYIMQLLIFLKNIKNINIFKIYYGMFEMRGELGYAPIVDLSSILSVNDWIIGAYNFKEFGNTYKIADLLEKEDNYNCKSLIEPLRKFAEVKNLNYISDFRSQIQGLLPLRQENNLPELGQLVVTPIMKGFLNDFQGITKQEMNYSTFQYRMAKWHKDHHNYGYALMLLVEACVTYCCEELGLDYDNVPERNLTRNAIVFSDDQKGKKDVIKRRIELIIAFDPVFDPNSGNDPDESLFDTFILGREEGKLAKYKDSDYIGYKCLVKKYECLENREKSNSNNRKESRYSHGNGFKTQNANRNLIAHNGEGRKSYSCIINELNEGIKFFKDYLDKKPVEKDY